MTADSDTVFIGIVAIPVIAMVWHMACSLRAMRQRRNIMGLLFDQQNWWDLRKEFHEVSFDRHHLALLFFRDPAKLYGPRIRRLMEAGHDR